MTKEIKEKYNTLILEFINRWLKTGMPVQGGMMIIAKKELEELAEIFYSQGKEDGENKMKLDAAIINSINS